MSWIIGGNYDNWLTDEDYGATAVLEDDEPQDFDEWRDDEY